jgi:HAD superfamily hydrolase (TIGR01509 family)
MNMKAVIFDMDGVMLNNNPWHLEAWLEYARFRNIPLRREEAEDRVFGRTNREIILEAFPETPEATIRSWSQEKEALYRKLYLPDFTLAAGLESLLHFLRSGGFKLAVASNAPRENVDFALDTGGIRSFFDAVLFEGMANRPKPFPDIYLLAASMLGFNPEECLVIEDSPAGIKAGVSAGCRVVGITSTFSRVKLQSLTAEVVDSLTELPSIINPETKPVG